MEANLEKNELVELTAEIVSAYVSNNTVVATDLPGVIHNVFDALSKASSASGQPAREELKPAVPLKKSVTPEYIICLEDGIRCRTLTNHLRVLGLTPEQYRLKWGLPDDYPMSCEDSRSRSRACNMNMPIRSSSRSPRARRS